MRFQYKSIHIWRLQQPRRQYSVNKFDQKQKFETGVNCPGLKVNVI